MGWYKKATGRDFGERVKTVLKSHPFTKAIADYYHIPLQDIDNNLSIEVDDLQGEFAKGNGKVIRIDRKLLNREFFKENFHFIIHEFFHWVKRRSEASFYFNDPEEVQSFVLQMTWQLLSGRDIEDVKQEIYPIIQAHFQEDQQRSKQVFREMLQKAQSLYKIYQGGGPFTLG